MNIVRASHLLLVCLWRLQNGPQQANAIAALSSGGKILDSSIGGIGGCPFVPRATGNIATEDLLYLTSKSGYQVNFDESKLLDIVGWLRKRIPNCVSGQLYDSGYFL